MSIIKKRNSAIEHSALGEIKRLKFAREGFVFLVEFFIFTFFIFAFLSLNALCENEESYNESYNKSYNETFNVTRNPVVGYNEMLVFICDNQSLTNQTNASGLRSVMVYEKSNESNESNKQLKIIFNIDFNISELNLSRISVLTENNDQNKTFGYTIINGLEGILKNAFVTKLANYSFVCVKDSQVSSKGDFSIYCNSTDEILLKCESSNESFDYKNLISEKKCFIFNNSYLVTGINNSGILEGCFPNYSCSEWSNCISGFKSRVCNDLNNCSSSITETQNCTCISNWSCSEWSSCVYHKRKRTCIDISNCSSQRIEEESCSCTPSYTDCSEWSECANGVSIRVCEDALECTEERKVETRKCSQNNQNAIAANIANTQAAMVVLNVSNSSNKSNADIQRYQSMNELSGSSEESTEIDREINLNKSNENQSLNSGFNKENSLSYLKSFGSKNSILLNYRNLITGFVTKNFNQNFRTTATPLIIFILIICSLILSTVYAKRKSSKRIIVDVDKLEKKKLFSSKPREQDEKNRKLNF
ncbi:MAG: hypothetical protein ACP5OZ_02030 [Candidatus Woesearchaeota archaeon]